MNRKDAKVFKVKEKERKIKNNHRGSH